MIGHHRPYIVGIGGTPRLGSTAEMALRHCLKAAEALGADTELISGPALELAIFDPGNPHRPPAARRLVQAIRRADGVMLSSPAYHGTLSGFIKNALDYVEDLRDGPAPYLEGRAVGCIVCADGTQAIGTALVTLRSIIHSLRGWPTPFAATVNAAAKPFAGGGPLDEQLAAQLAKVAGQVMEFAEMRRQYDSSRRAPDDLRVRAPAG
ncbi:NAD(P)H-dependent oxidoreductase [Microbaculum marinum]|uniref:NAD(P)H-dependent oxidoreductase n=1 Tax=Microbaculum marinum TaxID=1764581 RepID=A0AAW9RVD7_9HYPH